MFIICGIVIFVEPATYSAKTTQTYSITALNDNFSSYVGRYYTEDGLYYSFLYQTDKGITVRICEFLGFSDTDQLKRAKFFAIQETYSPIPVLGVSINNGDPTWRLCEVDNNVRDLYSVDEGYKIRLKICNEFGGRTYYQSNFLSLLKSGHIVYCPNENKYKIKHIVCAEKISDGAILIHEFDSVEEV